MCYAVVPCAASSLIFVYILCCGRHAEAISWIKDCTCSLQVAEQALHRLCTGRAALSAQQLKQRGCVLLSWLPQTVWVKADDIPHHTM